MDDTRTMAQLLEAPTAGYRSLVGGPKSRVTTLSYNNDHFYDEVPERPEYVGKAYAFPFSSKGADPDLAMKKTPTSISHMRLILFDETFYEAWDRFNDLLRACPHHGFSELHQLDTFYNALNSNDQDSLNSAAGGNFLDKMPRDCLRIIESKSKVRNSLTNRFVAKVSTSTSTPGISSDVAELKDMVKAFTSYKKNQSHRFQLPTKRFRGKLCNIGGALLPNQTCPATTGNVYRDNIQEYVVQPPAYQAPAYQAPAPQIQGVSKEDFQAYVKANDAVMRNMQTQGQNMQNQLTNLTDMLSKFVTSNTASTSGTLPSNTVTNPKEDLKDQMVMPYESAFITRSLISNNGPLHQHCSSNKDSLRSSCKNNSQDISDMTPETNAHYESEKEAIHLIMTGIEMKSTSLLMHVRKLKKCGRAIGEVTTSDPPIFKMSRQLILGVWSIHFLTMERQLSLTHKILQDYE
ncbi:hypothetical protein Tco_0351931 [Tanacetum coccineum]